MTKTKALNNTDSRIKELQIFPGDFKEPTAHVPIWLSSINQTLAFLSRSEVIRTDS